MIRGMNASKSGMAVEQLRTDVLADNLANINTHGFKRSAAVSTEFEAMLLQRLGDSTDQGRPTVGSLGNGTALDQVVVNARQGDIIETGRSLDLALEGPGHFVVQRPDGTYFQTRNGAFRQMGEGSVVSVEGYPLMLQGPNGELFPLTASGAEPEFQADGTVLVGGREVGRLAIAGAAPESRLHLRSLETSNVELAQEMTDVMVALRSYQVNQRAFQIQDQTLGRAVTEIGKI